MQEKINPALSSYIPLAKGIARTFGNSCEVVVHDLSHPKTSVIFVVNGHVSGRKVGDGIRDLLLDVLSSPNFHDDGLFNYQSTPLKGIKKIKSSTMVIRNQEGKMIGAFCINLDISAIVDTSKLFQELSYITPADDNQKEKSDIDVNDVIQIIDQLIDQTVQEVNIPVSHMKKEDFIKMMSFMDDRGVFLIKGAVEKVANKLNLSKYTVYGYLKEVDQTKKLPGEYDADKRKMGYC